MLPEDVDTITGLRSALKAADTSNEGKKVASKEGTVARKAVQAQVEASIAKIVSAAELAFVEDPARLALYQAVVPAKPKKKPPTNP